jgi:uncharacterized protein YndB with AHSA1/START domain
MTDLTVNVNKTIHAPIEKVFDAWLNPKMLSIFMMPMPGMPESDVENDAREGGNFTNISLSHVKFIDEKTRSDHEGGWGNILDKLNDVMSSPITTI